MSRRRPNTLEALETRRLPATITVAPAQVVETDVAARATFTVSLDAASTEPVTLSYATANGTARAGRDYVATRSSVTIPAGATSASFSVPVLADAVAGEGAEKFYVNLKASSGNTLAAKRVAATIVDGNVAPTVTASDLTLNEPTAGRAEHGYVTLSLSSASASRVRVSYTTIDGTALSTGSGREYQARQGFVTFKPGQTSVRVPVRIYGNATSDETFDLAIRSAYGATLSTVGAGGTYARVVIRDPAEASRPTITVANSAVTAGNFALFTVSLSAASAEPVSFRYMTQDGTGVAGTDYTAVDDILTIPAGQTTATIAVPTTTDAALATTPSFSLKLSAPANGALASPYAGAVISPVSTTPTPTPTPTPNPTTDQPSITVAGGSATVGTSGTSTITFTVSLTQSSTSTVTVDYATADSSAVAGTDYVAASGTLTFAPGVTSQTVTVTVNGEATTSTNKTFSLVLSNATNSIITSNSASGVITYATGTPDVAVSSPSTSIGTSGTSTLSFVVSLSTASAQAVTIDYATTDGTAVAGTDYVATSGTLTFAAGVTSQTVTVTVNGEATTATSKSLTLTLSNPTNATDDSPTGIGTINYIIPGQPSTVSSNLTATSAGVETSTGTTYNAASFTTGDSGYTLNSVDLLLAEEAAGATGTVAIYSDVTGQPGVVVGTLTSPATFGTTATSTAFTSTGGITLTANTTYWVVLIATSGSLDWSWTADDTGTGVGFTDSWAQSSDSGTTWFTYNSSPTQMSVTATPNAS